jgi:hypothetical protein
MIERSAQTSLVNGLLKDCPPDPGNTTTKMLYSAENVVFRQKCRLPPRKKFLITINLKKLGRRPHTAMSQDGGVGDPITSSLQ